MKARQTRLEEATAMFDDSDTRSFNEIYAGKEELFEDVDDLKFIDPRKRKLFEEVYGATQKGQTLRENDRYERPTYNPGSDGISGIPSGHNPALSKGPTSLVRQSGARQDDDSKLGSEPPKGDSTKMSEAFENIYRNAQKKNLNENRYGNRRRIANQFEPAREAIEYDLIRELESGADPDDVWDYLVQEWGSDNKHDMRWLRDVFEKCLIEAGC